LREKFNPRNINHRPAVKFFVRLDLDPICLFLDGHQLAIRVGISLSGPATGSNSESGIEIDFRPIILLSFEILAAWIEQEKNRR